MAENRTQRLFFALWPDAAFRDRVQQLTRNHLRNQGKRVSRENLHVTLVFLGPVNGSARTCVEAAAESIRGAPFTLEFDQLVWWARPRVVCVSASHPPPALLQLAGDLGRACEECGFAAERRPYRAHLTLARKVANGPPPTAVALGVWQVRDFCLVASRTLATGAEYSVLRSWPLG
ncbi:MAG: RNA 2',3'-cyclic phosphodiesterase [Gammaproteobacteria bacterium]|nr:RNA 2',3'-cyclic phosphodiesterase [Gammaproteobacteria bacterium]